MSTVRAAGGVVWRGEGAGRQIALVHRPRYDDWTLPKGKLDPDEHPLHAALREVIEETGVEAVPQVRLPTIGYLTGQPGVQKSVEFWSMRLAAEHGRAADHEIDAVRWSTADSAMTMLTYAHDRGLVATFVALPAVTNSMFLVRHGHAGSRHEWVGDDAVRPLDELGGAQAIELAALLFVVRPARLVSASPQRCVQTLEPLAAQLGTKVEIEPAFDETSVEGIPAAVRALHRHASYPGISVICSQGKVIPPLLASLHPVLSAANADYETQKGDGWLLALDGERLIAADRLGFAR